LALTALICIMLAPVFERQCCAVDLTFLGTRGNIKAKTRRHRRHSALFVEEAGARILIDCGRDWLGRIDRLRPTAIVLTHGHPDHAGGLGAGAPCPVYATAETWPLLRAYPIADRRTMPHRQPVDFSAVLFEAFSVEHSLVAPAVGYRISTERQGMFYVPDVVTIRDAAEALRAIGLYIGDGATVTRPIIRRRDGTRIGHSAIRTQLDWCNRHAVKRAIFTHCGSQIVGGDERALGVLIRRLGRERGVAARIARDGIRVNLGELTAIGFEPITEMDRISVSS
jgi:phosphoribosyl 1,2-cyclic phosphodiesterase